MTPAPAPSGISLESLFQLISTKGLALVIAVLTIISIVSFGPKVYAKIEKIVTNTDTIMEQHKTMRESLEQWMNIGEEGNRISCATCWNAATDSEGVKRCACNPKSQ